MHILNSMRITADKKAVLDRLVKNRAAHTAIVREARTGYMKKAEAALKEKLALVGRGKLVALTFSLRFPVDQTKVYDTAIAMLEAHTGDTVVLDATQVRTLMEDDWDWKSEFYVTNAVYSKMAEDVALAQQEE